MAAFTTRPEIRGTFGAVSSTHWLASAVGMSILEKGGNAFDAAAAAGFTLQVVEPHLNGPLGEAPILVWSEARQRCEMICGQGVAPAAATIERFRGLGLDLIPGTGLLAAAVPAAFGAWMRLLRDWGTMPLAEILAPAIGYAEHGYPVVERISETIARDERDVPPRMAEFGGGLPAAGAAADARAAVLQPGTRRHLSPGPRRSRKRQPRGSDRARRHHLVRGFCRRRDRPVSAGANRCSTLPVRRHGGLLTGDDLARWRVPVETPVSFDYRGWTVVKGGPWSQGPVLLQTLALLQGFDLDDLDPLGPDFVHTVVECLKLAFADREAWYGDPDFVEVPMQTLLSPAYNDARRRLVGERASLELRPGSPDGRLPRVLVGGREAWARRCWDRRTDNRPGRRDWRADGQPPGRRRRRHLPCRCDRPLGQHGLGDAIRRLAAKLAGHSRTGLLPRHADADAVARRRACRRASNPASGRAARCRRRWHSRTARPAWPLARRAATSKTNGRH